MKVVLFCGGYGTRIRDYSESVPKPMVPLGYRPIMWHLMKYYAHFGHTDFILTLGYQADVIKSFFLNYDEATTNDFVMSAGGRQVDMLSTDIHDWTITFVDTGMQSVVADRLLRVRDYLDDEDIFLVNYSDGLTDLPLDKYVADFQASDKIAQFLLVQPPLSYHRVEIDETDTVTEIRPIYGSDLWINGGYFVFRKEFLDYIEPGDEIVMEPFFRLMEEGKLAAIKYDGFWAPMDTFKDRQRLEELWVSGRAPWELWKDERPF
ncbi:MAG TPA: sugar phosphate nucleotidyltransferase [Acidimicrobiia bacterium]|jgi:glucose-1-phosphate cytidylyltransferase|nr:sugar phosphate nucleotidyltransferase [Acidimicrobiia bacterium]